MLKGAAAQAQLELNQPCSGEQEIGPHRSEIKTNKAQYRSSNKARNLTKRPSIETDFIIQSDYSSPVLLSTKLKEKTDFGGKNKNNLIKSRRERLFDIGHKNQIKAVDLANIQVDFYGRNQLFGGTFTVNDFNSEGTKNATRLEAIEDNIIHSDPGVDSVLSERISRKVTKRKPKRKEDFKDGKIRRWNEFVILRGKNEGNAGNSKDEVGSCVWNKKFDWKVYTRRSKNREKVSGKRKVGKRSIENFVHVDWQGIEEQHLDSSQSTDNSSSENLESDNEVFEIEDMDSEKEREEGEEAGFEGMRCLLG